MTDHFNGLSSAEAERLALLVEECAEVIQAATKVLRHGYESQNPMRETSCPTNRMDLVSELGHLEHAVHRLCEAGDVESLGIVASAQSKAERIGRWLHHQEPTHD